MIRNPIYMATPEMCEDYGAEESEGGCVCVRARFYKTRPRFQHITSNCFLIEQIVDTGSNTQCSHV